MTISGATLKQLRSLRLKKFRRERGLFIVEGSRLVGEALRVADRVEQVLYTEEFKRSRQYHELHLADLPDKIDRAAIKAVQARQLSETQNPPGIFALCRLLGPSADGISLTPPVLVLDNIADPGNLGTLLRTADWFGISSVLVSSESADVYNSKVVRGAMGAHFHIDTLIQDSHDRLGNMLAGSGLRLIGATMDGGSLDDYAYKGKKWALIIGSEAHGISDHWATGLDTRITIPGRGKGESLNVAVAAGILLNALTTN